MNSLYGLFGFNRQLSPPPISNHTYNDAIRAKPTPNGNKIQKFTNKTLPNNTQRTYTSENSGSDDEIDGKNGKRSRKGISLNPKSIFSQNIIDNVIESVNNNQKYKRTDQEYITVPNIAIDNDIKDHEVKQIIKLSKDFNNIQVYNHMNAMKIGRQELLTENIQSSIVRAESTKKKGLTTEELQTAMTSGAKMDIEQGIGRVKNPECVKDFTISGISKYIYEKVKEVIRLKPRLARKKYGNRSKKLLEVYGFFSQALTYLLSTFVNPKRDDLGERMVDPGLTFNTDDFSVVFGHNLDDKFEVLVGKESAEWMKTTGMNPVANIVGDLYKRTCFHGKPIVSELGRNIAYISYLKESTCKKIEIYCLQQEIVPYAFYLVGINPNVPQEEQEFIIQTKIVIPCMIQEKERLIHQYITQAHFTCNNINGDDDDDDIEEIGPEDAEFIRMEARNKYNCMLQLVDGAQGLIKVLKEGRLKRILEENNLGILKGSAQHSLCWNALDSGMSFMATHAMVKRVIRNGSLSPLNPPWFAQLQIITKKLIPDAERRKTVDAFHSHLYHMIARAFSEEFIAEGWSKNGMGIGPGGVSAFSFNKFMNHWSTYPDLPPDVSSELTNIFWEKAVPLGRSNNCTTDHTTMHAQLQEIFDFPDLKAEDNRSGVALNQGFAMVLNEKVFQKFAKDRMDLDKLKKERGDKLALEKKEEKKRLDSLKKIEDDKVCAFFDKQYEENLNESRKSEEEKLKQLRDKTDKLIETTNKKKETKTNTKATKTTAIKVLESSFKEAAKLIKSTFTEQRKADKTKHLVDRKKILKIHDQELQRNGARNIRTATDVDITDTAMNDNDDDDDNDDNEKMSEENDDPDHNHDIHNDFRDDPDYWKCSFISKGIRCTSDFVDKCPNNNCKYSNEPLCANCWTKHKHVFE